MSGAMKVRSKNGGLTEQDVGLDDEKIENKNPDKPARQNVNLNNLILY